MATWGDMTPATDLSFDASRLIPYEALEAALADGAQPYLLVLCGSLNPTTLAHTAMLDAAARQITSDPSSPAVVVGGFVSPVSDGYGKPTLAPAAKRIDMATAAVAASTWIAVDGWEGRQIAAQRTFIVVRRLREAVTAHYLALATSTRGSDGGRGQRVVRTSVVLPPLRTVLICGADTYASFFIPGAWGTPDMLNALFSDVVVAVVERHGVDLAAVGTTAAADAPKPTSMWVLRLPPNETSSTAVRRAAAAGDRATVASMVAPEAVDLVMSVYGTASGL